MRISIQMCTSMACFVIYHASVHKNGVVVVIFAILPHYVLVSSPPVFECVVLIFWLARTMALRHPHQGLLRNQLWQEAHSSCGKQVGLFTNNGQAGTPDSCWRTGFIQQMDIQPSLANAQMTKTAERIYEGSMHLVKGTTLCQHAAQTRCLAICAPHVVFCAWYVSLYALSVTSHFILNTF